MDTQTSLLNLFFQVRILVGAQTKGNFMKQTWQDYERAAEHGPMAISIKIIFGLCVLGILVSGIGYSLGWFSETAQVTQEEFASRHA